MYSKIYMEYIENAKTLKEFLMSKPEIEEVGLVLEKLGKLIAHIHSLGIIHGDLTTTNICLIENNTKFVFFDFGLCQFATSDESRAVDLYVLKRSFFATWECSKEVNNEQFGRFLSSYGTFLNEYADSLNVTNSANKKTHVQRVVSRFHEVEKRGRKRDMIG